MVKILAYQNNDAAEVALRRQGLDRQKRIATGLLVLMAVIFIATLWVREPGFWTLLIRTASEAGIVGGLADWFAVTALFRHPLGIPVPHTALVPHNKDRIGENLGTFFARHFLTEEVVLQKLRSADIAEQIGTWLEDEKNAAFFTEYLFGSVPHLLDSLNDKEIQRLINATIRDQFEKVELGPALSRVLALLLQDKGHRRLLDQVLDNVREILIENRDELNHIVMDQSRWWVPRAIDQEMARLIVDAMVELLQDLNDEEHEIRHRFDAAAFELIDNLEHSSEFKTRANEIKQSLVENAELQLLVGDIWMKLKGLIVDQVNTAPSELRQVITQGLNSFGRRVTEDADLRQRMNRHIETLIIQLVLPWRFAIGQFITEVVQQWDTDMLCDQIELEVGRDLQFIRINGSLVGSLVGAVLFLITQALA